MHYITGPSPEQVLLQDWQMPLQACFKEDG